MSDPTTIIVPTINARPDLLTVCQDECLRTMRDGDRFLVVSDGTFAENCNAGAVLAETPTIIFLNDDCKPDQDDWIDRLLEPFEDEEIGIVGCRLIYPDGRIQHAGVHFVTDEHRFLHGQHYQYDQPSGRTPAVTGACMAVRTDLFHLLGGFDTHYRNGNEDMDLCLRARNLGQDVWYTAEATLIHHESKSGPARWSHVTENILHFNEQWEVLDGRILSRHRQPAALE